MFRINSSIFSVNSLNSMVIKIIDFFSEYICLLLIIFYIPNSVCICQIFLLDFIFHDFCIGASDLFLLLHDLLLLGSVLMRSGIIRDPIKFNFTRHVVKS